MIWDSEDRAAILEAHGEDVAVPGGDAISGIYRAPSRIYDETGIGYVQTMPEVKVDSADLATHGIEAGANGTLLTVRGQAYQVTAIAPDGTGFSMLTLERVP